MSRIEPRTHLPIQSPSSNEVSGTKQASNVAGAMRGVPLSRVRKQHLRKPKEAPEKISSVAGNKAVLAGDIQPLRNRRKDQLIGDISRIISKLDAMEGMDDGDDVSKLCKVMLHEHVRRLSLISGTQIESDTLKGTA